MSKQLKDVAKYSTKRIPIENISVESYVTTDNLLQNKQGKVNADKLPSYSGNVVSFKQGDILISNIRPYLKKIWYASHSGGCLSDVLVLTIKKKYDSRFVYYALFHDSFFENMMNGSKGTKMPRGDKNQILDYPIPDLNFHTQQSITKVLYDLDAKIDLNNQINQELEAMAKLLYDYWFVQFDFPNEDGKPYKSSGGKMVYNEELKREIPEGWKVKILGKLEPNIVTGKTPPRKNPENFDGDIPFICIGDVRGNMHVTKTETTLSYIGAETQVNKYIPKGAICVTCIATPGLIAFASEESQTNQQLNSIVCKVFENQYYLYFYLKDYFKYAKAKTGNTFANMNKGDFSSIKVIQPNIDVLTKFATNIKPSIESVLLKSQENIKLAELRDWLLPMLMNGQVTLKSAVVAEVELGEASGVVAEGRGTYSERS